MISISMLHKTTHLPLHHIIRNTTYMKQKRSTTPIIQHQLLNDILLTLIRYSKSQLLIAAFVSVVTWGILILFGVRYAVILSVLTGALSVVPVFGMLIASSVASLVAVFDGVRFLPTVPSFVEGLVIFGVYGMINFFVDYFASPYIFGRVVQVHPLILLLGIAVATALFGIPGAILSTPIILVIKTVLDRIKS